MITFPPSYINSVLRGSEFHKTNKTWAGKATYNYKTYLEKFKEEYSLISMLDFGSGKGVQYSSFNLDKELGLEVTAYDPCIHGLDHWPTTKFDLVISLDCFTFIDVKDYRWLLNELDKMSNKLVFISVQTENKGKEGKKIITSEIEKISNVNQITENIPKDSSNKFFIMDNFKFV